MWKSALTGSPSLRVPAHPYGTGMFTQLILTPGTPTETVSLGSDKHRPWESTAVQKGGTHLILIKTRKKWLTENLNHRGTLAP